MKYGLPKMTWNDNTSLALSYLLGQSDCWVDFTEPIYRVEVEIPQAPSKGVLLHHKITDGYYLDAQDRESAEALWTALPEVFSSLTAHGEKWLPFLKEKLPHCTITETNLWKWPGYEPPKFPLNFEVWPLDEGDIAETLQFDPTISEADLGLQIHRKLVYGACIQDTLAGTIGTAPDGRISYWTVSPDFRGQGIGKTLLLWMIRRELRNGHVPFLYAEDKWTDLLEKIGCERAKEKVLLVKQ